MKMKLRRKLRRKLERKLEGKLKRKLKNRSAAAHSTLYTGSPDPPAPVSIQNVAAEPFCSRTVL